MFLAGDVGGTKTDLMVFSAEAGPRAPVTQAEFSSASYPSLEALVREFLSRVGGPIEGATFGVAGPVIGDRAQITNLPWVIDVATLAQELALESVHLLNDLEATARAVPLLRPDELHTLAPGGPVPGGATAVVAPGTGLGEAFLTWDGSRYRAHPSEGGHADFAPTDPVQVGLLEYLARRYDHVSVERVCSGLGVPNVYDYLRDSGYAPEPPELAERLAAATDRTPPILSAALDPTEHYPLCVGTLETFVTILGAEAGNLALKVLATGGVYLAGGIPPRILPSLEDGRFLRAFHRKGRFAELLERVPVHVVVQSAALLGAAIDSLEVAQR